MEKTPYKQEQQAATINLPAWKRYPYVQNTSQTH